MYQAQVSKDAGPWRDQGPVMPARFLVQANVDGYRRQAEVAGQAENYDFRIVEVDSPRDVPAAQVEAEGEHLGVPCNYCLHCDEVIPVEQVSHLCDDCEMEAEEA